MKILLRVDGFKAPFDAVRHASYLFRDGLQVSIFLNTLIKINTRPVQAVQTLITGFGAAGVDLETPKDKK